MNNKRLIKIAKVISTLFMPLYAPLWVFFGLFLFSYMRMLPWSYKLFIMGLVYFFAVTLLSYGACLVIMTKMNTAMFFRGVVMSALICQIVCVIINAWWKVSTHMVGMGGLVGALNAFSILFFYNPVWPFCALLLLSGALGTSRIILRQHSLAQVLVGFGIGYLCTMTFILMSWM